MKFFVVINLFLVSSILFSQDEGEKTLFYFEHFSLDFREGNPSRCDNSDFTKTAENEYLFEYTIDWQYSGYFQLLLHSEYSDSFNLYDRYVNSMAIRESETEGVHPFDTTVSDLPEINLFYFSPWVEMKDFSFEKYGYGKSYWQPSKTGIDTVAFQRWYVSKVLDQEWYDPNSTPDKREVFCYQRQLKFVLYRKRKSVTIILKFLHRDGTC